MGTCSFSPRLPLAFIPEWLVWRALLLSKLRLTSLSVRARCCFMSHNFRPFHESLSGSERSMKCGTFWRAHCMHGVGTPRWQEIGFCKSSGSGGIIRFLPPSYAYWCIWLGHLLYYANGTSNSPFLVQTPLGYISFGWNLHAFEIESVVMQCSIHALVRIASFVTVGSTHMLILLWREVMMGLPLH